MSETLLVVEHLSARSDRNGGTAVLRDVSLTVQAGQIHGLVGESGAGKSTIARAVLGILPRSVRIVDGVIRLGGRDLARLDPRSRRRLLGTEVALIPQDPLTAFNPGRTIEAQLTDGVRLWKGLSRRAARRRALELLDEVRMKEPDRVLSAYPHQLSGGMRQRVLIAAAFALEPKLVVADEPTTALDVTVQKEVLRLFRTLQERHGAGVLFVSHNLAVVAQVCGSATLLYGGRVIEEGPGARLLDAPAHAYTRALMAASPRHDRPGASIAPVPEAVLAACRAEIAAFDRAGGTHG